MATEFEMPKLGLTMEEATIIEWYVADGDDVAQGAVVLSIETDKVSTDVEASASGLLHITGGVGETFLCGARIGWFLKSGETPPVDTVATAAATASSHQPAAAARAAPAAPHSGGRDGARLFASPNARRVAAERGVDLHGLIGTGPGGRIVSEDVLAAPTVGSGTTVRPPATGAAAQVALRLGVDLAKVRAGGPGPSVSRADVERHVREQLADTGPPVTAPAAGAPEAPLLQLPTSTIPLGGMRGTIASRMHSSLHEMAQLTLTMDVVMDPVVQHRSQTEPSARPGYTDYVLAAVAGAIGDHPVVNSQILDGRVLLLPEINLGLAVALDGGLVVPVVHRTNTLSLDALSRETTRLATAARAGTLTLADLEGGTFSVTALGMFGVDMFTPIVNPPNTAILGVGRLRDGVRWVDDVPTRTKLLTLSLTWDHRAFDGAPAAEFTAAVRDRLEGWE